MAERMEEDYRHEGEDEMPSSCGCTTREAHLREGHTVREHLMRTREQRIDDARAAAVEQLMAERRALLGGSE